MRRPGRWETLDGRPDSASHVPGKQVTPWRLLALLMAMTAIGPATLNILVPALPGLVTRLASDTGTVQLTLSLYLLILPPPSCCSDRCPTASGGARSCWPGWL